MKKLTLSIVILTVAIFICSNVKSQNSSLANIDEFILDIMESYHVPGLSACIIKGDSVVWNNNYGLMNREDSIPVNDSTLFNTWCISKPIIAACVFQLIEDGLLDLDQNINDFMPFQIDNPWTPGLDTITPRMLMAHSSSINCWQIMDQMTIGDSPVSLSYFLENYLCEGGDYYFDDNYYDDVPGSAFNYDSYATSVAAYLIEPLLDTSFSLYAHNSVLTPLDMNTSAWFLSEINLDNLAIGYKYLGGDIFQPKPHYGHPAYPTLTLRSTAYELSNFVIMLLNQGVYKGLNILSSESIESMTTIQDPTWTNWLGTTGIGLFTKNDFGDRCVWGHDGGGVDGFYYCSHLYFCEEEKSGIVIMSNSYVSIHPIVIQMFDYAGLFVMADTASQISDSSFYANWQTASIATGYLLDVAYNEQFTNFVNGLENHDVGLDTNYYISGLNSNTDYFYRVRAYNSTDTGAYSNLISLTTNFGIPYSCLPEGITFSTQEEIDNFQTNYPNCTEIEGEVVINGADITNLNGLSVLIAFGGDLVIGDDDGYPYSANPLLNNLTGLDNVTSIGGMLVIKGNIVLTNLTGLDNVTSIGGKLRINFNDALIGLSGLDNVISIGGDFSIIENDALISLAGLENVISLGGDIDIQANGALTSLASLENIISISGYLHIIANHALTSLTGLENVTSIGEDVLIKINDALSNLTGLENVTSIGGDLNININNSLTNITALNNVSYIGGMLRIYKNNSLSSLTGLDNLVSIGGNIKIERNDALSNLSGLENLISIGGNIEIKSNDALSSLTGLENLISMGGNIEIMSNDVLSSLTGLENLISIEGNITIWNNPTLSSIAGIANIGAASIDDLVISSNPSLSTCDVQSICDYLVSPNGAVEIRENTIGCNNPWEIANACGNILPCLPYGNYYFTNQTAIDNFADYADCTELEGDVVIGQEGGSNITNLNGLSILTSIGGNLNIGEMTWVVGPFPGYNYHGNPSLESLTGLGNITSIGNVISIIDNTSLTSLDGLENICSNGASLRIIGNDALTSLAGLENMIDIEGDLWIADNASLSSLTGLDNLTSIEGDLYIGRSFHYGPTGNPSLISLTALQNVTSIGGALSINLNNNLISITGLESLTSLGDNLWISGNASLSSLTGLENLISIGGELLISYNGLVNLTGLDNVTSIGGALWIYENSTLNSLTGLDNIEASSIYDGLHILDNPALSTCDVQSICDFLASPNGSIEIYNNAPGCNHQLEVEEECEKQCLYGGIIFTSQAEIDDFKIDYPNCTEIEGSVEISGIDIINLDSLIIITSIGGSLEIEFNDSLTSLTGLNNLTSIGGDLGIVNNDLLYSITDLDYINSESITNLYIHDNDTLSDCDAISICEYLSNPSGLVEIYNNEQGCNDSAQVKFDCDSIITFNWELRTEIDKIIISPNPLKSTTLIQYNLYKNSPVILKILDLSGREIVTIVDEVQQQGEQKVVINTHGLPAGIYFCVLKTNEGIQSKKMIKL